MTQLAKKSQGHARTISTTTSEANPTRNYRHRSNTKRFQAWLDKNLQLVQGAPHEYTPQKPYPEHILNYEVQNGRDYKVVEDRLELCEVVREDKPRIMVWRLEDKNEIDSAPRVLELFNVHFKATWKEKRNGKATVSFNNALEIKVCPSREKLQRLAPSSAASSIVSPLQSKRRLEVKCQIIQVEQRSVD
ncbi:hypothetical protein V500_05757 [Pseudogymnoascus sp. VKM F-4518 (FW-2643)]|nr:hypothetical protein V500_05757 [Pseudogymnoascus sp. VKM F-4518 (FW-2643)]